MNDTIKVGFRNRNQVVLFEAELKGQISDGQWENAGPRNHYKAPCLAVAFVASNEEEIGRNFFARAYNFSNSDLLEVVGERMINQVKMAQAFPHVPINQLLDVETNVRETILGLERYSFGTAGTYYKDKLDKYKTLFGVTTTESLISLLEEKMSAVNYTMKDLRRDLNDMKKCWRKHEHTLTFPSRA